MIRLMQSQRHRTLLQLHAEGGSSYLWVGPGGFKSVEPDPRIDNINLKQAGKYYVYISNEGGCFGYAEVTVTVIPSLKAVATANPNPVQENNQLQFSTNSGVAYL